MNEISTEKMTVQTFAFVDVLLWQACNPVYMLMTPSKETAIPTSQ